MSQFNFAKASATLQDLRKTGERKSALVVSLGETIITKGHANKLGDEVWSMYEQVFIAALDLRSNSLAKTCLEKLETRFPGSPRVKILQGMELEAEGKLDIAIELYKNILEEDETNVAATKRMIASSKAKGQWQEAIDSLSKYLDTYYNDTEAWLELSALYLQQHLYQQARFCLEEVILLQPQNHLYHLKYAEILYTSDNIALALREFCRVVELCDDYLRGLYGIKLCTQRLLNLETASNSSQQTSAKPPTSTSAVSPISGYDVKTLYDLNALATERILHAYSRQRESGDDLKVFIKEWLQVL
ncbi:hypothetical protein G9A89_011080 [Geosiphon pyriformis]|nr:hypothetical protein G9A89_011080 [Geosiphon pyriformis]